MKDITALSVTEVESFVATKPSAERLLMLTWLRARSRTETHFILSNHEVRSLEVLFNCSLSSLVTQQTPHYKTFAATPVRSDIMRMNAQIVSRNTLRFKTWSRSLIHHFI